MKDGYGRCPLLPGGLATIDFARQAIRDEQTSGAWILAAGSRPFPTARYAILAQRYEDEACLVQLGHELATRVGGDSYTIEGVWGLTRKARVRIGADGDDGYEWDDTRPAMLVSLEGPHPSKNRAPPGDRFQIETTRCCIDVVTLPEPTAVATVFECLERQHPWPAVPVLVLTLSDADSSVSSNIGPTACANFARDETGNRVVTFTKAVQEYFAACGRSSVRVNRTFHQFLL